MNLEVVEVDQRKIEIKGNPRSIGTVIPVIGIDPRRNGENMTDPLMWMITELKSKPETEKVAGMLSAPAETRKEGEDTISNIIGALVDEFSNDPTHFQHLYLVDGLSIITQRLTVARGQLDGAILIYRGPLDAQFQPTDEEDVKPYGWIPFSDLQRIDPGRLRTFVLQIIQAEKSDGIISRVVDAYLHDPLKLVPLSAFLPPDFTVEGFRAQREMIEDVVKRRPEDPRSSLIAGETVLFPSQVAKLA